MSGQLIELIIFAGVAFFVINKLISTLGTTSKDGTFFGESGSIKDVTHTGKAATISRPNFVKKKNKVSLKGLVVVENAKDVESSLPEVLAKLPSFKAENFLKGAKAAFQMILSSAAKGNQTELETLIDKRYIGRFVAMSEAYGELAEKADFTAHISEMYLFGNNVFVKVLFAGKNITNKVKDLREEWTFAKNALVAGPEWHLTNIDKA
jgi:predicted lipid-binding transport protein (Tim44 family)